MGTSIKLSTRTRKTGRQADRQTDVVPRLSSLSLSLSLVLSSPVPLISRMLLRAATPINQLINESINRHRKLGVHPGTPNPHPSIHLALLPLFQPEVRCRDTQLSSVLGM